MQTIRYVDSSNQLNNRYHPFFVGIRENMTSSFCCHWHENIEFMIITKGTGHLRYGTTLFQATEGDIFIINRDMMHYLYSTTGIDYYNIAIANDFFNENEIAIEELYFTEKIKDLHMLELCKRFKEQYIEILRFPKPLSRAILKKCALELTIELCSKYVCQNSQKPETGRISEDYVRQAMLFIKKNYTSSPRLEEIAQHLRISRHHLEREFKKCTNQTITHYTNTIKCKKAVSCLMSGMSVTETANECGFGSLSYFSRTFTKMIGCSPSVLVRKQH